MGTAPQEILADKNKSVPDVKLPMKSKQELLKMLAEADADVAQGRVAPVESTFSAVREKANFDQKESTSDELEAKLDEADEAAAASDVRYTEDDVFSRVKARIHGEKSR